MKTEATKKQSTVLMAENLPDSLSIKSAILKALLRVCQEDIKVSVIGKKAILEGAVESLEEKISVEKVVLNIPQINEVENRLRIDWLC